MAVIRGYTWACDRCGETVAQDEPAFSQHNASVSFTVAGSNILPPPGWFGVIVNVEGEVNSFAFCRYKCLKQYLKDF